LLYFLCLSNATIGVLSVELHGSKNVLLILFCDCKKIKPKLEYSLGVSIAVRKYPVTSRTWKSSSLAAKVVPGELGVRIARCTLHFIKKALERGLFCYGDMFLIVEHFRLIKRFLFLLIPYSILRIGYLFYHFDLYRQIDNSDIFLSLFEGIRFDIAAICLLNLPVIFLALIPSKNSKFNFLERFLFVLINSIGFLASVVDYELTSFTGKRLSFDLFLITDDIWDQLPQLAVYYWYFPFVVILLGFSFYLFDKKYFVLNFSKKNLKFRLLSSVILLSGSFVGIRGGLQHKSISIQSAFTQGKNELGHLVLNTPYHFLRTLKNKTQNEVKFFKADDVAFDIIKNRRNLSAGTFSKDKKNIVLIILESFSLEYVEAGYTPFLSELISKSLYFPHHLANGRRSIESLPSLLCGLPSLLDEPISKSIFQGNKFVCMPKILKEIGYTNYFFHGGAKGTMGFESYTLSSGFDRYFSKEDDRSGEYDGTWGIYDVPYLQFAADEISSMPQPFLAGIFTLSSHQPYSVPKSLRGKFPKGTLEIHESIGYTDYALKKFFEKIQNQPWFSNTVFFITADHASKLESKKFQNLVGNYRVPFLIYAPGQKLPKVEVNKVSQHSDIPRTMLEWSGIKSEGMAATSVDLLRSDIGGALNYASGREYIFVTGNDVLRLAKDGVQKKYKYDWETGAIELVGNSSDPILKAYLQYFINGLIKNNLSVYR
jgi:phosphoglycerol transferase MdoB-like AlkP superfamily enzyme